MRLSLTALAVATLSFTLATPAYAGFAACAGKEGSKLEKCEAKEVKSLAKLRANTTPYKPSDLDKGFASLDGDDVNPFNMDYHYFGVSDSGIKKLNDVANSANQLSAVVRMANYIGELNTTDAAAATELGGILLPHLEGLDAQVQEVSAKAKKLASNPNDLVDSPMEVPKAVGAVGTIVKQLASTATSAPGALKAIMPIAKGAGAAAAEQAVGDATGAAGDAVSEATESLENLKK